MNRIKLVIPFLFIALFCNTVFAQPHMVNFYMPGFQFAKADYEIFNGDGSSSKGYMKARNVLFRGDAISNGQVFHVDMTYLLASLLTGFEAPKRNLDGGVFEAGWGMTFKEKEKSLWAWSVDIRYRGVGRNWIAIDSTFSMPRHYFYLGVGASIYYLRTIGDRFMLRPKFSFAYGGGNNARGTYFCADMVFGIRITDSWGISFTGGAYNVKTSQEQVNPKYFQIGICNLFNK